LKAKIFTLLAPAAAGLFLEAVTARAQDYSITDLGTPGGAGTYSESHGINLTGAVAGEWGGAFTQNAFLYQGGTNLNIVNSAVAYALDSSNDVVGQSGAVEIHGFLYSSGMFSDLGTLGGSYSIAWAIHDSADIVGESTVSSLPNAEVHALWWHNGMKIDLGILPGGDYSSARGINASNVIVGEASVISGTVTNIYAFTYTNGVMTHLPTLPGGTYASARAINDSGDVVGEATTSGGDVHAFLYHAGVMSDLGTFGGNLSSANAINDAGLVVGYAVTTNDLQRAFLFNGSTLIDLNNLIPASSGFTNLISADGINDIGQITGSGYTSNGDYHAFLLTPASVSLSAPGILPNGQFEVTVNGAPGQSVVMLASSDLTAWVALSTNQLVAASFSWVDPSEATNHARFYRAMLKP
jgi:probable HAF family extracellular repeat protein